MTNELDYYKYLTTIMLTTRGTRFTAAESLIFYERFSISVLALLSIYLVSLSVVLMAIPEEIGTRGARFFGALSIISAVWILVASLFDYALARGVRAHQLQENALRITGIVREMERELQKAAPDLDLLRALASRYEQEVASTHVNHSTYDYKIYMMSRKRDVKFPRSIFLPIWRLFYIVYAHSMALAPNILVIVVVMGATLWYILE